MNRTSYGAEELNEFKQVILQKIAIAEQEFVALKKTLQKNNTDFASRSALMPDDSAEVAEIETLSNLARRQLRFINNLKGALARIENGTYGVCKTTGKLISKARLLAVPHTTQSVEAKQKK